MSVPVRFEPMTAADLDAVVEIERRSFPAPWSPGLFLHELRIPFSRLTLARLDDGAGRVVGYVCRWLIGDEVHILNLAVDPDHRRRGIGRALLAHVLDEAAAAGARVATLEVRRGNEAAASLYRRHGFTETGVRRNYYGEGADAVVMSRPVGAAAADRGPR